MRSTLLFAAGVTLALSGCGTATQVGFSDPSARAAALERFHAGTAGMSCGAGFDCTFKWIVAEPAMQRMAQAQKWDDLADVVMAAGMDVDAAWFYLGLAAQGENYNNAARVYYETALRKTMAGGPSACATFGEEFCTGIDLPDDANKQMASLGTDQPQYAAPRHYAPTHVATSAPAAPAPAASTSAAWVAPAAKSTTSSSFVPPASGTSASASSGTSSWVAPAAAKP